MVDVQELPALVGLTCLPVFVDWSYWLNKHELKSMNWVAATKKFDSQRFR